MNLIQFVAYSVGLVIVAGLLPPLPVHAEESTPTIHVTGSAERYVAPDTVVLKFTIESRAKTVQEATKKTSKRVAEIIAFSKQRGIDEKYVRTESLLIQPFYKQHRRAKKQATYDPFGNSAPKPNDNSKLNGDGESSSPTGYSVRHDLSIKMKHPGPFEQIYPGLIERGVNGVTSIEFHTSQRKELEAKMRVKAIQDAKKQAEALVAELGTKLAGVQSIHQTPYKTRYHDDPFGDPFGEEPQTIASGQIQINASIKVTFRIGDSDFE